MYRCCAECFGDPGLTHNIIPHLLANDDPLYGYGQTCDFCKSENVATVLPLALADWFEMVRDL